MCAAWCCGAAPARDYVMSDVYSRPPRDAAALPRLGPHLTPINTKKEPKKSFFRKKEKPKECEVADEAGAIDARDYTESPRHVDATARVTVRGREELPCACDCDARQESEKRECKTLPRRRSLQGRRGLPPRRTTPDGTDIYYWCDLPRRRRHGTRHAPLYDTLRVRFGTAMLLEILTDQFLGLILVLDRTNVFTYCR